MFFQDSSSNTSSCNSSTPSSPAVMVTSGGPTPPHSASIYQTARTKFPFPDPPPQITLKLQQNSSSSCKPPLQLQLEQNYQTQLPAPKVTSPNPIIDSVKSYDSDKTLSGDCLDIKIQWVSKIWTLKKPAQFCLLVA